MLAHHVLYTHSLVNQTSTFQPFLGMWFRVWFTRLFSTFCNPVQKLSSSSNTTSCSAISMYQSLPVSFLLLPVLTSGYRVIGSHSGVKLCRWTKSMLRGRGGCYKHTFYGIESHRCMEATPSLACANKCVFCWRHHTNPVGTEWKWRRDDPDSIVQQSLDNHYQMIKQFKGVCACSHTCICVCVCVCVCVHACACVCACLLTCDSVR